MKRTPKMKKTAKMKMTSRNEDKLKNEDNLKHEEYEIEFNVMENTNASLHMRSCAKRRLFRQR